MSKKFCRSCSVGEVDPASILILPPKCCPDPVNHDPRRFEKHCKPVVSYSEPLSHAEYLRRKKELGGVAVSSNPVQVSQGEYKRTLWMEGGADCCYDTNRVLPAVPPAMPPGYKPESLRTEVRGAIAGRSSLSHYDQGDRGDALTTLREKGDVLAREACGRCTSLEGTDVSTFPGRCTC